MTEAPHFLTTQPLLCAELLPGQSDTVLLPKTYPRLIRGDIPSMGTLASHGVDLLPGLPCSLSTDVLGSSTALHLLGAAQSLCTWASRQHQAPGTGARVLASLCPLPGSPRAGPSRLIISSPTLGPRTS